MQVERRKICGAMVKLTVKFLAWIQWIHSNEGHPCLSFGDEGSKSFFLWEEITDMPNTDLSQKNVHKYLYGDFFFKASLFSLVSGDCPFLMYCSWCSTCRGIISLDHHNCNWGQGLQGKRTTLGWLISLERDMVLGAQFLLRSKIEYKSLSAHWEQLLWVQFVLMN